MHSKQGWVRGRKKHAHLSAFNCYEAIILNNLVLRCHENASETHFLWGREEDPTPSELATC